VIRLDRQRAAMGMQVHPVTTHAVFHGPPGTGKTTVARLIGKIYQKLGVLPRGQVVETDRSKLVARYVGQTAALTNKVIDTALNGVLFIDEAYSLMGDGKDFGPEAIDTLLKRMEDDKDRLCVIVAGYENEMKQFIASNPGLQSRFANHFQFASYDTDQLLEIFKCMIDKEGYLLEEGADQMLRDYFEVESMTQGSAFGNGRFVRNTLDGIRKAQATRLAMREELTREDVLSLTVTDVKVHIEEKRNG